MATENEILLIAVLSQITINKIDYKLLVHDMGAAPNAQATRKR
jgi:hypothetical protein